MSRKPQRILAAGASLLALTAGAAQADQVINDNLIVSGGSLCVGVDCVSGESFGFDTLRLKENNLRIHFNDTSVSASFPTRDWTLIANDSANGGANYFAIEDRDAGTKPFLVEADAGNNAVYVKSTGYVGFGTSSPVVDLHVKQGNSPALRLEQDGSSGFTSQTWDIAGNETNFFIRDVTNGSELPFRIEPGADDNSIYIEADNDVGIGTNNPSASLHVRRSDATAAVLIEETNSTPGGRQLLKLVNNGNPQILLQNTNSSVNQDWEIGGGLRFVIKDATAGTTPFKLETNGDLTLTGSIITAGSCSVGCDRVFDEAYELPTIEEHAKLMLENKYLPNVGPTAESGQYELTSKVLGMLNELEQAHLYIVQLNDRISQLEQQAPLAQ